jgi:S-DNA-T family DNA segregation ATPase FtsK/SpoIIIE
VLDAATPPLGGGLLGGGLAQAMLAVAGSTGAIVLIAAMMGSMLILVLNVSLSRAVDRTAQAIRKTGQRMDQAVRSGVDTLRENRTTGRENPKSYDLLLPEKPDPAKTPPSAAGEDSQLLHKPSFMESLRRLWQADEPAAPDVPAETAADLAVPAFLRPEQTGLKPPPIAQPAAKPHSPYDIKLPESDADEAGLPMPAGVHRIGATGSAAPYGAMQHDSGETVDPRAHWADRATQGPANAFSAFQPGHGQGGAAGLPVQIALPYQKPPLELLKEDLNTAAHVSNTLAIQALGRKLEHTLETFGIQATVVHVTTGPTITRFELTPGPGVKVSRIVSLADDIALNLAAMGVRIEAPIPGKSAIGIEIPNKETTPVLLRGLLESPDFQRSGSPLTAALGRDIQGNPILCDLTRMPHLLIAGATGSGKSVCINVILMSILYRASPEDVRMIMIDPKVVELSAYNGIPHLLLPVVTDTKKAANALVWAVNEMIRRYGIFAEKSVRDITAYQAACVRGEEELESLPLILLVIDELADLMQTTPTEVEDAIARLTAMARAAGIHLIIATQRPSVDVITGVIKANIPSRIAFAVASQVDSRTILDMAGAEKLLGKGDLLYYPQSAAKPIRGQGAFILDAEVEQVLSYIKSQHPSEYDQAVSDAILSAPIGGGRERDSSEQDELLPQALGIIVEAGYASVSLLQRRMNVGYPRAARLIDRMQEMGYVGPFEGSKPRKVLISQAQYLEMKAREDA